jgi:hypothetical protein
MSSHTFSDHFCTPAPVYRPNQVPTVRKPFKSCENSLTSDTQCPFEEELLPTNSDFIYDMDRLSEEKIDNYANMLCYTIPSLNALVFFRWVVYRSTTVDDLGRVELDPVMDLERTMGNHGVENKDLYTITPCSYAESLQAYRRLMVSQAGHRILLQQLFQRRGIYEKYRLFIDSYEVIIGPTAYSTKVHDPPKAVCALIIIYTS